jgi:hypothetical protein
MHANPTGTVGPTGPGRLYLDFLIDTEGEPGQGVCYLIHFSEAIGNPANPRAMAQHYIGHSADPPRRFARHVAGHGSRIVAAAIAAGITVELAATWPGDRRLERRLKRRHDTPRWCPTCRGGA